jgi:anti-sigma-K factor RskA
MNYRDPQLRNRLAAEYVLGTLTGRARQRFARLAYADANLRGTVREWEARLLPFAEAVPPVAPPDRVWQAITARLFPSSARRTGWFGNVGFWRPFALAASVAVVALGVLLLAPRETTPQNFVALLSDDQAHPVLYVSADRAGRMMSVKTLAPISLPSAKAMELWVLPEKGAPRSLGLIAASGTTTVQLSSVAEATFSAVPAMAISIEPSGGSPTGLPTGPVVYKGPVVRLW